MSWVYFTDPDRTIDTEQGRSEVITDVREKVQGSGQSNRHSTKKEGRDQLILPGFEQIMQTRSGAQAGESRQGRTAWSSKNLSYERCA